jgi:O-antigen/teichoic acid export membrane protein
MSIATLSSIRSLHTEEVLTAMTEENAEAPANGKTKRRQHAQVALGSFVCASILACFLALLYVPIPPESKEAVMLVTGAMIASFSSVVNYYFGSSVGSKTKDETIVDLSK